MDYLGGDGGGGVGGEGGGGLHSRGTTSGLHLSAVQPIIVLFPGQIGQQMSTWLQSFYPANMSKQNDSVGTAFECRLKHHTSRIWQTMRYARSAF